MLEKNIINTKLRCLRMKFLNECKAEPLRTWSPGFAPALAGAGEIPQRFATKAGFGDSHRS
jgi:hypothetical protein